MQLSSVRRDIRPIFHFRSPSKFGGLVHSAVTMNTESRRPAPHARARPAPSSARRGNALCRAACRIQPRGQVRQSSRRAPDRAHGSLFAHGLPCPIRCRGAGSTSAGEASSSDPALGRMLCYRRERRSDQLDQWKMSSTGITSLIEAQPAAPIARNVTATAARNRALRGEG